MAKVTVIIPVYKAEQFLERCVRHLMEQTLDDMEYIFINDCTPDNSMNVLRTILRDYPARQYGIKIIENECNMGTAFVRTVGLKAATGEYVGWCDADDWCDADMYEQMYKAAKWRDYDIVTCNYTIDSPSGSKQVLRKPISNPHKYIYELYTQPYCLSEALWDKIVRRSLLVEHDIYPFCGIDRGEDFNMFVRTFYFAHTCKTLDASYYHYWVNPHSMTKTKIVWEKEKENFDKVVEFLETQDKQGLRKTCDYIKFTVKHQFKGVFTTEREWFDTYRECHRSIMSFTAIPFMARLFQTIIYSTYTNYKIYKKLHG